MEFYFIAAFQIIMLPVMLYAFASCVQVVHFMCDPDILEEEE